MTHEEAVAFFSALYGALHRIPGSRYKGENVRPWGSGSWQVAHWGDLSTYDFDTLTRLVLLAHDRCISPRARTDSIHTHHPTIEQAIERFAQRPGEF